MYVKLQLALLVQEDELDHQLSTGGNPPGLLPGVNSSASLGLVVPAVQQHAPPHQLTTPTLPTPGPTSQSLVRPKPTAQSHAANIFALPEVPARPTANSTSSGKTGTAVGTTSAKPPPLPVSKRSTAAVIPAADQSLGTSRYMLEIPQISLPTRSSTAPRNATVGLQSEPRGAVFQRQSVAGTLVPSVSIPARIPGSRLQTPSLQNPPRPQLSTPTLSMARGKAATQQSKPPGQPRPGFQLTLPVAPVQGNTPHAPRPGPPQRCTTGGASETLGKDSAVKDSESNSESTGHSLPSKLAESQPAVDGENQNGSKQAAQNWESGPVEQPEQQYNMEPDRQYNMEPDQQYNMEPDQQYNMDSDQQYNTEPDQQYNMEPDRQYNMEPDRQYNMEPDQQYNMEAADQQYNMEAADHGAEVDPAVYEGYYPSEMQGYAQQYAMYGGQYANNGDTVSLVHNNKMARRVSRFQT